MIVNKKIIVIIPVLNPSIVLVQLIKELIDNEFSKMIIVNDGSSEAYNDIFGKLKQFEQVDVLTHVVNQGKGRALKTAFNYVLQHYSDYRGVVTVDADGQHKIQDVLKCIDKLDDNAVFGCRQFQNVKDMPFRSRFGNTCTRFVLKHLCDVHVADSQTGLRVFPISVLPFLISVQGERYEYETNALLEMSAQDMSISEVSIEAIYENNNESSHFNPIVDSLKIYSCIMKYSRASIASVVGDNLFFIIVALYSSNIWLMTFIGRLVAILLRYILKKNSRYKKKEQWYQGELRYMEKTLISGCVVAGGISLLKSLVGGNVFAWKIIVEIILVFILGMFKDLKRKKKEDNQYGIS